MGRHRWAGTPRWRGMRWCGDTVGFMVVRRAYDGGGGIGLCPDLASGVGRRHGLRWLTTTGVSSCGGGWWRWWLDRVARRAGGDWGDGLGFAHIGRSTTAGSAGRELMLCFGQRRWPGDARSWQPMGHLLSMWMCGSRDDGEIVALGGLR